MGNQQSEVYETRVGFEDVQRCIYESAKFCVHHRLNPIHEWNINHFDKELPNWFLINTMKNVPEYQSCVLPYTIPPDLEETIMNWMIKHKRMSTCKIIVYGLNTCDAIPEQKYTQLKKLGFTVYIYQGGMFEWLLLQDIYGDCRTNGELIDITQFPHFDEIEFPTTQKNMDILRYRPATRFPYMLT